MQKKRLVRALEAALVVCLTVGSVVSGPSPAGADPRGTPKNKPEKGLVYDGLEKDDQKCKGGYKVKGHGTCTHGPDEAPEGADVSADPTPAASTVGGSLATVCAGDGVTGKRTQVIYARSSDRTDRYATFLPSFRQWALGASQIYMDSAAQTGGSRRIRFVHDANCVIDVANVVMPTWGDDTFGNTITALKNAGHNRTDRKYMVFVDANVYCGIGNIDGDTQPGSANANNGGPDYGRTDAGCWGAGVAAHEHMHNIGGVQLNAPHTSGGWHCTDENDRMCYSDSPNYPTMQLVCPASQSNLFDCNDDDYYNTSAPAGSYLATNWNAANSQFLIGGAQSKWGYVWAHSPSSASYTASNSYAYNSVAASNSITKNGVGDYTVRFPGLGVSAGTVNVTAYGSGSEHCKVVHWFPSGADQLVRVRCFTTAGALADTLFTASFVHKQGNNGPIGYVWADQPSSASYTPSLSYQYNSTGGTNTISRSAVGVYQVHLPGLGASAGNVKVTAYGAGSELCKVVSWGPWWTTQRVNVACFTAAGAAVDTPFTLTYVRDAGVVGLPGQPSGYVWADQPSSASYTPSASYAHNASGGSATITRSATGVYQVRLAGLASQRSHVQVSAYGNDTNECKVSSWGTSGDDTIVNVRCFSTGGTPVDTRFTMNYSASTWV